MRCSLVIAPLLAALTWPAVASAQMPRREDVPEDHPGHRHAIHPNLFGSKLGYVSLLAPDHEEGRGYEHLSLGYAGLFYERSVFHEWLEIELAVGAVAGPQETAIPIDLYFKKPFHPSPRITPYIGGGPLVSVMLRPERRVIVGLCVTFGAYIWFSQRWGLDVDLDLAVAAAGADMVYDVLLAVGPTVRF